MFKFSLLVMVYEDCVVKSVIVWLPSLVIVEDCSVRFPIVNNVLVMVSVLEFNVKLLFPIVILALVNEIVDDSTGCSFVMLKVVSVMVSVLESSDRLPSLIVRLALSTMKRVAEDVIKNVVVVILVLLIFSFAEFVMFMLSNVCW